MCVCTMNYSQRRGNPRAPSPDVVDFVFAGDKIAGLWSTPPVRPSTTRGVCILHILEVSFFVVFFLRASLGGVLELTKNKTAVTKY